jgi:endoglucanase Acf2/endonuclease/exonuclease/phosphatase family metal-dependent hydrolase
MQPFMNDTFDWPQWPALDVSDSGVIEYFQSMVVLGDPAGENLILSQRANRYLAEESTARTTDTQLAALLAAGKIAAEPHPGSHTPSDHEGTTIDPLVTDGFNQPVPSSDWWSSVQFAKFGDPFSAPLHVHPLTVQLNDSGLLVGAAAEQTTVVTGTTTAELKTPHQFDLQLKLFAAGQRAASFALDSYSDWSFTGSWQGNSSSTAATLALASPMVWLADVELANLLVGFNAAAAEVQLDDNVAQVAIAGRNYAVYAPEGISWTQDAGGLRAVGNGLANVAVALLPDGRAETRALFGGPAARPVVATRFDYAQGADPYSLELTYQYDLDTSLEGATTVVAYYPHLARLAGAVEDGSGGLAGDYNRNGTVDASDYVLWSDTRGQHVIPGTGADGVGDGVINGLDYTFWKSHFGATALSRIGEAGYLSPRGTMSAVTTDAIGAEIPARGVLPNLPDLLTFQQRETLAQLVRSDPQANDPQAYLDRWQDTYWSGKSMLKMMQLAQMADVAGENQIRSAIVGAVQNTFDDWFSVEDVSDDRHFAYNKTWDTLQGYPDSFGSAGDLNDHHFHYGYFVHAAALVGIYDPFWVVENRDFVDVIIADVANVDASSNAFPRLRNFSPMAGHSWASGHGAFASGNNQESSSEAMNFATGVMLWGEVAGSQETTRLGQMLYSLEAEAISQYWFDKYGTTYPGEFDFESVGMIWGDGAAHATWFSAEVEMIKGINLLPFHGGSLYLSEAARDPAALLQEIAELNGGEPDVWQGLLLQYEALVDPASALAHYSESEFDYEEGQSPAHTYFWMTTLANLGSPTSAIRGDYALSAVFAQEGLVTYAAHNPTGETIEVQFSDGAALQVAPYSAGTTTSSELPVGPPADPPANDPADPGNAPPSLEDLEEGRTLMLVGQTFQGEYTDFIDGTGLTPAGSSHYATFYLGNIEQGDDSPNAAFLDHVRDNDLGDYAMVALSLKDNTPAGGYGQMVNQGAADFNSNAIWEALDDIRNGAWDAQIDSFAQMMASRPETQFLVRVGYEVSLLLFAYNGDEHVVDWLNQNANAGVNVFENPDALGELDRWAFIDAYNHIVDRIEPQAANVEFGYHPVRGFNDTQWLYPGEENVDWVGFSVFNNDICMEVSGTFNCPGERIDPNLAMSIEFARQQGHEIVIAESTAQNPAASNSAQFIEYLDRLDDVVQQYDVSALVYINSDWPAHGWGPEWGDSRIEADPAVEAFFLERFADGTRYVYADMLDNPIDPPVEDPGYDDPPVDPPIDDPMPPTGGPDDSYNSPGEEVTYGFGLIEEGQSSAYDATGFNQGEFVSNINFSHRATADPLVAPGNPNFWHAHDFFVNPSTDADSTLESLMAVDGSSAQPTNNESVYWVPSLINETSGEYVTPLDSSIAYYRIARPYDPDKLEAMPTGLSVIAGSAMPTERQSIGIVAWNYIGSSERYDHLPIGDEWQDLPLQALIYFPTFWDGENVDSANHKSHMAYAAGNGGPSTHPYLLPQLELQIHYGKIPPDAQLVLTSDYMTKDHPDYAPGWSLHADHIHLPWPEFDSEGNIYDGFERRVTDSMRFPIFAGTDGNSVRTILTGAQQPFTPEPFYTYTVFPGQDPSEISATTLPILVSSTPTTGAIDVPVGTAIKLVFDEGVVAGEGMLHLMTGPADDPKTAPVETHASVEMFSATDPRVAINGNTVTITLANELAHGTTYHLDIGSGGDAFLDTAGNGYQRDHADYHFTTTDGVGIDFTIAWPGNDIWMGVGNTSTIYGQVHDAADVARLYATIQNVESGLYQRTDGTFGEVDPFEITVNAYDGHWFFLYTPATGGTYRIKVFAIDPAENVTSRNTTFGVHGDSPSLTAEPPVVDLPAQDPPASNFPVDIAALELVAEAADVRLLVDTETQLAYVQEVDSNPILIRRADDYWSGDIPLSRDGATLKAAARDALGRLRVLDVGPWGPFAWILDESGMFIGQEGPTDSSVVTKEILFGVDLTNDGWIGESTETMPPAELPANLDPGGDVVADGVQVRLMTFNVYYASLGAPERIDGIAQAIADYTPDIASIQEMWGEKDQILASVEAKTGLDYAFSVGSNTWDGDILYRADRWRILDDGVVTYDGSRGMSYATLEHLSTGEKMSVYGMHPLAGVSEDYHLRNIDMATAHMAARPYAGAAPIVLLGDMNAHENSESMRLIRDGAINAYGQDWSVPVTFEDTFRVVAGDEANGDTGFGVKIDYVYIEERADPAFRVEGASIRNDAPGGSDHFPVMAEIVLLS